MVRKDAILSEAMQLPAKERLDLAERLIASVAGDKDADAAWADEIARRVEAIDAGTAKMVPWEEARKRIAE